MPYENVGTFYRQLHIVSCSGASLVAKALQFTLLTACRSTEALSAQWQEIDWKQCVWTVPDTRTKNGSEHRVPLVDATLEILATFVGLDPVWIFPGRRYGHSHAPSSFPSPLVIPAQAGIQCVYFSPKGCKSAFAGMTKGRRAAVIHPGKIFIRKCLRRNSVLRHLLFDDLVLRRITTALSSVTPAHPPVIPTHPWEAYLLFNEINILNNKAGRVLFCLALHDAKRFSVELGTSLRTETESPRVPMRVYLSGFWR